MTIDKFWRSSSRKRKRILLRGGVGDHNSFMHTPEGNIDFENLKLCNLNKPSAPLDVTNKQYVDDQMKYWADEFSKNIEDRTEVLGTIKKFRRNIR